MTNTNIAEDPFLPFQFQNTQSLQFCGYDIVANGQASMYISWSTCCTEYATLFYNLAFSLTKKNLHGFM